MIMIAYLDNLLPTKYFTGQFIVYIYINVCLSINLLTAPQKFTQHLRNDNAYKQPNMVRNYLTIRHYIYSAYIIQMFQQTKKKTFNSHHTIMKHNIILSFQYAIGFQA